MNRSILSLMGRVFYPLFFFFFCQFSVAPASGQNGSAKTDEKYGKILSGIVENQVGLYEAEKISKVVDTIGQKLANQLKEPGFNYTFKILDLEDPNAFSLPGGYIYVTRGLLALVNNEDELAGVIGHEIIHSQNRHVYQQMKTSVLSGILQLPANIAGSYVGSDFGSILNAPFELGSHLIMSGYSKKNEKEADMEGILLAAASGYDPLALHNILKNIQSTTELKTGKREKRSYFSHHPFTPRRLEYIRSHAVKVSSGEKSPIFEEDSFLDLFNGLTMGENPDKGIFVDNVYLHPEKEISITFPKNWQVSNISKAVLGMTPDENALVFVSLNPEKGSPEKAAKEFLSMISKKDIELLNKKALKIQGLPAYVVTLRTFIEDRLMFFQNLWVQDDTVTYNIIGTGTEEYLDDLKFTGLSFGKLKDEELAQIEVEVLQIVKAQEGENLKELSERICGDGDTRFIEILNSLDKKEKLPKGRKVKVIVKKKYKSVR